MAFTEIAQWNAVCEMPTLELRSWRRANRLWFNLGWLSRPASLTIACILHLLATLILAQFARNEAATLATQGSGLKLFSLPSDAQDKNLPSPQKNDQTGAAQSQVKAVDPTPAAEMAPTEWSISRFRVPRSGATSVAMALPVPGPVGPASPSGATGGGGSSGFDPYAGASPRRPGELRSGLPAGNIAGQAAIAGNQIADSSSNSGSALQAFLARELKSRFPQLKGNYLLAVQLDDKGRVSDILVRQGHLDRAARHWLRERLKATPDLLASAGAPGAVVAIPEIRLL
jgi:hypothetical protein